MCVRACVTVCVYAWVYQRRDKELDRVFRDNIKEAVGGTIDGETFKAVNSLYKLRNNSGVNPVSRRTAKDDRADGCVCVCTRIVIIVWVR